MPGQGVILGVGAMEYPAEFQGAALDTIVRQGISKTLTLTSTYDHRIIQGAQSGSSCAASTSICWARMISTSTCSARCAFRTSRSAGPRTSHWRHDDEISKTARVQELIHAYRVRGHLMADIDPWSTNSVHTPTWTSPGTG